VRGQGHASAAFYPRERPGSHCTGGWVGPRAGLDRCRKYRPYRDFFKCTIFIDPWFTIYSGHVSGIQYWWEYGVVLTVIFVVVLTCLRPQDYREPSDCSGTMSVDRGPYCHRAKRAQGIFDPRTVQLVASRYTDYATRPTSLQLYPTFCLRLKFV
jgi:hypothetical protein